MKYACHSRYGTIRHNTAEFGSIDISMITELSLRPSYIAFSEKYHFLSHPSLFFLHLLLFFSFLFLLFSLLSLLIPPPHLFLFLFLLIYKQLWEICLILMHATNTRTDNPQLSAQLFRSILYRSVARTELFTLLHVQHSAS